MLKVIVAGSRDFDIFSKVEDTLMMYFKEHKLHRADIEIVSGAARGADRLGEQFAEKYGLKLTKFLADWDKYGKSAGYKRNAEMAKYADVLFAFWDGISKGTQHMINLAKDANLDVHVIYVSTIPKTMIMTADDEEPDCGRCDYITNATDAFCNECGNNYWCHYQRTII